MLHGFVVAAGGCYGQDIEETKYVCSMLHMLQPYSIYK